MESTAFDMIILPISLAMIKALAACWLFSKLAEWADQVVRYFFGHHHEASDPHVLIQRTLNSDWRLHDYMDSRYETSPSEVGPRYRQRHAG
jgi:hypothetical protein